MLIYNPFNLPLSFIGLCCIFSCSAIAASEETWELGAGVGAIDYRLYPGSKQSKTVVLPLPYFTYYSKYLEIDRGIRGLFPSDSNWFLDISADFGLPVSSKDSIIRSGMPNLEPVLQFGPSIEYSISGSRKKETEFRLELPLRVAISIDTNHLANEGYLFEPRLVYEKKRLANTGLFAKIRLGLRFATRDYNAYYYDVSPAFSTPQRNAFSSNKGFNGFLVDLRGAWRDENIIYWGLLRYHDLSDAVFANSPLIEDKDYFLLTAGISWIFAANQ